MSCLFRHHNGDGVAVLRDAERCAMAQTKLAGYAETMRHGQYAAGCLHSLVRDYHGTVVKWRVLEEDILNQTLVDAGVYHVAGIDNIVEGYAAFDDDKAADIVLGHVHASHHYGQYCLLVFLYRLVTIGEKLLHQTEALVGTDGVEEFSYLFLKENDYSTAVFSAASMVSDPSRRISSI